MPPGSDSPAAEKPVEEISGKWLRDELQRVGATALSEPVSAGESAPAPPPIPPPESLPATAETSAGADEQIDDVAAELADGISKALVSPILKLEKRHADERERIESSLQQQRLSIEDSSRRVASLLADVADLRDRSENHETAQTAVEQRAGALDASVESLRQEQERRAAAEEDLRRRGGEVAEETGRLKAELRNLASSLAEVQDQMGKFAESIHSLERIGRRQQEFLEALGRITTGLAPAPENTESSGEIELM